MDDGVHEAVHVCPVVVLGPRHLAGQDEAARL